MFTQYPIHDPSYHSQGCFTCWTSSFVKAQQMTDGDQVHMTAMAPREKGTRGTEPKRELNGDL
jgi:hypothetical protein